MTGPIVHMPSVVARLGEAGYAEVIVTLADYHPAAARALTAAYGDDWISVVPSSARYFPLEGSAQLVDLD